MEQVVQRAADVFASADPQVLSESNFNQSAGSPGSLTRVLSRKVNVLTGVRQDRDPKLSLTAFETFTTNGTGGDTETFNLSHDLVDSEAVVDSVALFKDDGTAVSRVQPDSVDYAADSFDFTDSGTGNDLLVFYTAGDQARLVVQKTAPKNAQQSFTELDIGLLHRRNQTKDPVEFDFPGTLGGVVPRDFRIDFFVNAPYTCRFSYDGGSEPVSAPNAVVSLPVRATEAEVPGIKRAVKAEIAGE